MQFGSDSTEVLMTGENKAIALRTADRCVTMRDHAEAGCRQVSGIVAITQSLAHSCS
jgi:hypothetical protein